MQDRATSRRTVRSHAKRGTLSKRRASKAAKAAKRAYAKKGAKRPASWKKGGREWSRVLGHFGMMERR